MSKITPACRAKLHCSIGKNMLNGNTEIPEGRDAVEYALYCLLCAVEELAAAIEEVRDEQGA